MQLVLLYPNNDPSGTWPSRKVVLIWDPISIKTLVFQGRVNVNTFYLEHLKYSQDWSLTLLHWCVWKLKDPQKPSRWPTKKGPFAIGNQGSFGCPPNRSFTCFTLWAGETARWAWRRSIFTGFTQKTLSAFLLIVICRFLQHRGYMLQCFSLFTYVYDWYPYPHDTNDQRILQLLIYIYI